MKRYLSLHDLIHWVCCLKKNAPIWGVSKPFPYQPCASWLKIWWCTKDMASCLLRFTCRPEIDVVWIRHVADVSKPTTEFTTKTRYFFPRELLAVMQLCQDEAYWNTWNISWFSVSFGDIPSECLKYRDTDRHTRRNTFEATWPSRSVQHPKTARLKKPLPRYLPKDLPGLLLPLVAKESELMTTDIEL